MNRRQVLRVTGGGAIAAATAQGLPMHPLQQALQEYPEQAGQHAAVRPLLGAQQPGRPHRSFMNLHTTWGIQ